MSSHPETDLIAERKTNPISPYAKFRCVKRFLRRIFNPSCMGDVNQETCNEIPVSFDTSSWITFGRHFIRSNNRASTIQKARTPESNVFLDRNTAKPKQA